MKKTARIFCFVSAFLILLPCLIISSPTANAKDDPTPPVQEGCSAYCLYDITHDRIVVLENGNKIVNTSTSAKVMMGLLACELLRDRCDETVIITEDMISGTSGYSMELKAGEKIKIIDLLYAAICGSYNDAAYALAYIASGSANDFVSGMNSRARSLSALSTHYTNPLGFPDSTSMVTTVSDTLKIAVAASQNELYMELCSAKRHECDKSYLGKTRSFYNRNMLVSSHQGTEYFDPDCSGMNAGMSGSEGGWSVITLAHDDGADYICIVLGGTEDDKSGKIYAYDAVAKLIDWARETYNRYPVFLQGDVLGQVKISLTSFGSSDADYVLSDDLYAYIPNHSDPDLTYKVEFFPDRLKAPISKGEELGVVRVYCNGYLAGEGKLVTDADYESNAFITAINALGEYTQSRAFIATAICFIVIVTISIFVMKKRSYG